MDAVRLNTSGFATEDQLNAWRGWFDGVFDIASLQEPQLGFRATVDVWTLGGRCALSRVVTPSVRVSRSRTLIRRNPIDPWVVAFGRDATTTLGAGSHEFRAPPGVPFVVSLGGEIFSERDADMRLQLYLCRDDFPDLVPALDAASGSLIVGDMGMLFADYMLLLERRLPEVSEDELPRLRQAISAMVAACVAPTPDRTAEAAGHLDLGRMERVRRTVRKYLRSPNLGPRLLCRHVGTSRSQLYRLFENQGGVARYIRRQRLRAAYTMLVNPCK